MAGSDISDGLLQPCDVMSLVATKEVPEVGGLWFRWRRCTEREREEKEEKRLNGAHRMRGSIREGGTTHFDLSLSSSS
jgi:hypothetical protein